jgi:hypothetical protein
MTDPAIKRAADVSSLRQAKKHETGFVVTVAVNAR